MELELKEYFGIIKKRIWMITAIVLVASITTGIISFYYMKPVYSANTKLIVSKSSDKQIENLNSDFVRSNIMLVNTYKEIIKTPAIMDKVAAKYPELGLPTDQLIKKVNISSVNDTQVITLTIEDNSYEKAVKTVNAISEVFKNEIPSIMKVDNVMILNEAQMVDKPSPVKPNKQLNLAISFVVSLMAAVGLAFLLEYLDDTIKTEADVYATLQLPVLVTIHQIKEEEFKNSKTSKQNSKVGETQYAGISQ